MVITPDVPSPPKRRPGPKPRGRTVVPLTITVTPAQRAALEARADAQQRSISAVVREFITAGLAPRALSILSALIVVTAVHTRGGMAIASVGEGAGLNNERARRHDPAETGARDGHRRWLCGRRGAAAWRSDARISPYERSTEVS